MSGYRLAIALFLVMIAGAGAAWWLLRDQPDPPTQSAPAKALPPPVAQSLPAPAGKPSNVRLRRLLSTRLGHPAELRIERVRMARTERYKGVACGYVAWGTPTSGFKRFIATRRNVLVEGRDDLRTAWRRVCDEN